MRIGGTIRFEGGGLQWIKRLEDGGVALTFADEGSCEFHLEFSPENSRRLAAVAGLMVQDEPDIKFKDAKEADEGSISAADFTLLLYDQAVTFGVDDPDECIDGNIPTIQIRPSSGPDSARFSGFFLALNVAQAAELVKRLSGFLEAAKLRREASKTKTIAPPARTKRTSVPASV
jgi:hypothetical protein